MSSSKILIYNEKLYPLNYLKFFLVIIIISDFFYFV